MRDPLVSTEWLAGRLGDPRVVIADVRWYLSGRSGADEYRRGHLPGAAFVDLETELSGPTGPGRHPLPTADAFSTTLARLGVRPDSLVVAYDDAGGAVAARLWWLLRYFGHDGGRVLDGGYPAWVAEGRPLETAPVVPAPAPRLALRPRPELVVDADAVAELVRAPGAVLLDARAPERYLGLEEPVDPRPGHIPGARNAPFTHNLEAPGGRLRSLDALRRHYQALGALDASTVVAYCGSGVTACHDLLALARLGRDDARLYEGSWSDWSRDPSRPAATGEEPAAR